MSHIQSHHGGTVTTHNTFLVIFKVLGGNITIWPKNRLQIAVNSFSILCHNVDANLDDPSSDIQFIILSEPASTTDKCTFQPQQASGQKINSSDLVIFMTSPVDSSSRASYAFDIIANNKEQHQQDPSCMEYEKVGSAYVYLDPSFSSQGVQKTPIVAARNYIPIGQIQVEYLIVTNPSGYGQPSPQPDWLYKWTKLHAGHRGAGSGRRTDLPGDLLENTIESFNYAHRNGADFCELDVLVSADGVPVVYHDFDVDAVTAHQSSDELGRFRIQVNEFTVKQLRDFRLVALQDCEGQPFTLNVPNQIETNRPFPTLAEVLDEVDETCGLNIEIKWPQALENGKMEARKYREINDFVDRIIETVSKHANNRPIVLESFEADLVIMLRLKQNRFPVMFLSQGMTEKYIRYADLRTRSVTNGVYFAQAFDMAGIDLLLDYYLIAGKKLVKFIRDHDLIPRAWGDLGKGLKLLHYLRDIGIQCITCDRIDQLMKEDQADKENICEINEKENIHEEEESKTFNKNLFQHFIQLDPDLARDNWHNHIEKTITIPTPAALVA